MKTRRLGKTGIAVSEICLGTMTFGGRQISAAEAEAQLSFAADAGVNFIDTAEMYPSPIGADSYGESETIIGRWLSKGGAGGKRENVVIATKISGPSGKNSPTSPPSLHWIRGGKTRHNREHIRAAVDESLRRLQTDYIDLYQLHWPDRNGKIFAAPYSRPPAPQAEHATPVEETLRALSDVVAAGKVRAIGLSNETAWGAAEFLRLADDAGLPRVASVQNPYNLLNRTYEIGLAEISAREECGLLAYSPLAFGVLTGKYMGGAKPAGARLTRFTNYTRYSGDKAEAAVADYAALAKKHGKSFAQMALAFTLRPSFVTSSIITATNLQQLQEDISAVDFSADEELWAEVEALGKKHFNPCP